MQTLRNVRLAMIALMSACLTIGISGSALQSQDSRTLLDRYQLDVWRAQDGVRLSFTSNLVQTHDGYLWLSTQSGLTRFDGLHFKTLDGAKPRPPTSHAFTAPRRNK